MDVGTPYSIITDHGTQFKGRKWKLEMANRGIKTYKTSIYHPSSNPAERVLREVGRVLRTYCYDNHKKWGEFISETETFLNIAHHETIGVTPVSYTHLDVYKRQPHTWVSHPPLF